PTFEAPAWVMKVFVTLIAAGFPLALLVAWAFEMTPEGIKRTENVSPNESIPQWSRRKFALLVLSLAGLAIALLVLQISRSRTSTQQYQSKPGNLSEIAKQLGVAHILEGSVQKSNDAVRVNVQLIKAEGDSHLWAETYDRKLTDIFAVETEVAERIARSLEA